MISGPEAEPGRDDMGEPEKTLNDLDQIQRKLGEGLEDDPRLSSGVPKDQRGSDIEFIQMSGLVRPSSPPPVSQPPAPDDLDATRPVSFFEKGVADVDADMVPGLVEDRESANEEIRPIAQTHSAMSHLRDIIADLTKDTTPLATDPALIAALDATTPAADALPPTPPEDVGAQTVPLDDMLSEFAPVHPMQHEAGQAGPIGSTEQEDTETPAAPIQRPAPVPAGPAAELAEAEKLLDELEPAPASPGPASSNLEAAARSPEEELPDEALDYKHHWKRRHRSTGKRHVVRSVARMAAGLIIVSALAIATYAGYLWLTQRMASPGQLFNQATRLMAKGDYAAASRLYEEFAALHPDDPLRPEAQFNAAFAMQLQKPSGEDEAQEITRQALRLFEQYRKDNPAHAKLARAETLMGLLHYESGRYNEAIELLRNPELRLRDPASAVPTLRTLARASAKMGDSEAARSYYLQAVGVQGNHSPDVDYAELGSLYQSLADRSQDLDKRIELQQLAIESWTHALEVPGIDPTSKQTIRSQLDVLRERLQSEPGMSPAMESLSDATPAAGEAPAAPTAETNASDGGPAPNDGEYVVKEGETLASIAEAHHVTVEELIELNGLKGAKVFDGQHLIVPSATP